jgi:hypothetical protein
MRNAAASRSSPADTITQAIIKRLEAGARPWVRPWTGTSVSRPLRACGIPYRGINTLWLWMAAEAGGYSSPYWLTYRQAQLEGGQVRKGERGTMAIFYKAYSKPVEDVQSGEKHDEARRVLKSFVVFNVCQVDGLGERYFPAPKALPEPSARNEELRRFFSSIPAKLRHVGDEAYIGRCRTTSPCRIQRRSLISIIITPPSPTSWRIGRAMRAASRGGSAAGSGAMPMQSRNWWPRLLRLCSGPSSVCRSRISIITPATLRPGSRF